MIHELSFAGVNPVFAFNGMKFEIQLFTTENRYELDKGAIFVAEEDDALRLVCTRLTWAGGQETVEGRVEVEAEKTAGSTVLRISAAHASEPIRRVKLRMIGVRRGSVAGLRTAEPGPAPKAVPDGGLILKYPDGWFDLPTPLLVLQHGQDDFTYFRSRDPEVRPKVFALIPAGDGLDVELLFEQDARRMSQSLTVPEWEVGSAASYEAIMEEQHACMKQIYAPVPWEQRTDVPGWAKQISLVASIHCQHWTGYVFNDYAQVEDNLKRLAEKIEPRRILAYLPGWEGRYYWQYGDLRPDPRMGGEAGFARLIRTAKSLGIRVMPMFMMNGANPRTAGFEAWGKPSLYTPPSGFEQIGGSCDWDASRHYDHDCGVPLNPGAPLWQDRLVGQVLSLIDEYGFDGVFMDLAAVHVNDRRFDPRQGAADIGRRIREKYPDMLYAGEGWYDAMTTIIPLCQPALAQKGTVGEALWHDSPYPPLFDTYCRAFGHLGMGDPSRASTGVFEWGTNATTTSTPLRKGIIPTVTIVDGTLAAAEDKIDKVIEDAKNYARLYLPD